MSISTLHFTEIDSTNTEAKRRIKSLTPDQTALVIVADTQTAGRGRGNHTWESSDEGGLYYTILLRLESFLLSESEQFVYDAGLKVVNVLFQLTGLQAQVEWPNDILLHDKKCGGILIETVSGSHSDRPGFMIIGIGLNLNQTQFPPNIKHVAISLRQISEKIYNKSDFIEALTKEFYQCR